MQHAPVKRNPSYEIEKLICSLCSVDASKAFPEGKRLRVFQKPIDVGILFHNTVFHGLQGFFDKLICLN